MKFTLKFLALLCFAFFSQVFGQSPDSSIICFEKTVNAFYSSIEEGNVLKRIELLDENVILMPNGFEMIRGKEKAANLYTADTATVVFKNKRSYLC